MAATPRPTPVDKYALGRNTFVTIYFENNDGALPVFVFFEVCISEGSVSLDTDTIEINSNCQNGWKVKLPGLKSGTASFTGYIASSVIRTPGQQIDEDTDDPHSIFNIMQYLGQPCWLYIKSLQNPGVLVGANEEIPFALIPMGSTAAGTEQKNGFFKTGSVTISPDDAVKVSMTIELSGEQSLTGFAAVGFMGPEALIPVA